MKRLLHFFTAHRFNRFDVVWLLIAGTQFPNILHTLAVILVGAIVSGILETIDNRLAQRTAP